MTKEEKLVVIDSLAEQLNEYPHFTLRTSRLRMLSRLRRCVASASKATSSWWS